MSPRVSVLIPTYNRARLITDAIDSVLAQTREVAEIVVVDDGSTDDTREVLRRYGDRVSYIYSDHAGPAAARNIGFTAATGDFLCLLDSDDLYYPHKVALQLDHFTRFPDTAMVYTDFTAFDDAGYLDEFHLTTYHKSAYRRGRRVYDEWFSERHSLRDNAALAEAPAHWRERFEYRGELFDSYLFDTLVFTNSMMFRRTLLGQVGLQNARFGHFHDLEFALRICKAGKVGFIDNPTYKLRYHPGQVSTTQRPDGEMTAIKLQRDLLKVARAHALGDAEYRQRHAAKVNKHIGRLSRAAAVPLIAYGGPEAHRRKYYPRRARRYLAFARGHGDRPLFLYAVSVLPIFLKRICFRLERMRRDLLAGSAKLFA